MKTIRFHPEAKIEFEAEVDYYLNTGQIDKARAFKTAMDSALDIIQKRPDRWSFPDKANYPEIRTYGPIKPFGYRIGYVEEDHFVYVVAYYWGGDKEPLEWMERVND